MTKFPRASVALLFLTLLASPQCRGAHEIHPVYRLGMPSAELEINFQEKDWYDWESGSDSIDDYMRIGSNATVPHLSQARFVSGRLVSFTITTDARNWLAYRLPSGVVLNSAGNDWVRHLEDEFGRPDSSIVAPNENGLQLIWRSAESCVIANTLFNSLTRLDSGLATLAPRTMLRKIGKAGNEAEFSASCENPAGQSSLQILEAEELATPENSARVRLDEVTFKTPPECKEIPAVVGPVGANGRQFDCNGVLLSLAFHPDAFTEQSAGSYLILMLTVDRASQDMSDFQTASIQNATLRAVSDSFTVDRATRVFRAIFFTNTAAYQVEMRAKAEDVERAKLLFSRIFWNIESAQPTL